MWILTTFFPYAFAIIIFISAARQFLINQEFNLPIFNYLDITDLASNIVNDLYGLTRFMFASILLMLFKEKVKEKLSLPFALAFHAAIFFLLTIIIYTFYKKKIIIGHGIHKNMCDLAYISLSCLAISIKVWIPQIDTALLLLFMILSFSFFYCKSLSQYVVYQLKFEKITKGTIIKFKEGTSADIISNETVYYIGHTTKYAFVYDQSKHKSTSYSMSNIASITTSEKGLG